MIVFTTGDHGGALVAVVAGVLGPGEPELLVGHLEGESDDRPLVVDLSLLNDVGGSLTSELLWRLGAATGPEALALVHDDLGERRSLRARTAVPVLPTVGEALHGHVCTSLDLRAPDPVGRESTGR